MIIRTATVPTRAVARPAAGVRHDVCSVDVEDYFHVEAFSDVIPRSAWGDYPERVVGNTHRLLDLLAEQGTTATFFFLGWVAERHPELVREVVARGHEPACHSYWHRLVYTLDRETFREDTRRAKAVIEQAGGQAVTGYRAPSYSITGHSLWALEVLVEEGFTYDSSIFPIRHDVYGIRGAPRVPTWMVTPAGAIQEFPLTTFRVMGSGNLPVAGGGYLRLLPFWYTRLGVAQSRREGIPVINYIHPWEIDPGQPRIRGRWRSRFRHYTNLDRTHSRLERLMTLGSYSSFEQSGLREPTPQDAVSPWRTTA